MKGTEKIVLPAILWVTGNELPRGKPRGIKNEATRLYQLEARFGVWTRGATILSPTYQRPGLFCNVNDYLLLILNPARAWFVAAFFP